VDDPILLPKALRNLVIEGGFAELIMELGPEDACPDRACPARDGEGFHLEEEMLLGGHPVPRSAGHDRH
jgi:hypothetical protein